MKITISVDSTKKLFDIVKSCPIYISSIDGDAQLHYTTANIEQKDSTIKEKQYTFCFSKEKPEIYYFAMTNLLLEIKFISSTLGIGNVNEVKAAIEKANRLMSIFMQALEAKSEFVILMDDTEARLVKAGLGHYSNDEHKAYFDFIKQMEKQGLEV